jgi:AcrR family transcriptional regulator
MKHHRADTRGRLLEAARDIFYTNGYQRATIQMIASEADANIAAVNYHFGDKASLLAVVIAEDLAHSHESMPRISQAPDQPVEKLREFVSWFFTRFDSDSKVAPLLREVSYGGDILEAMLHTVVRPEAEALTGILQALDPEASLDKVQRNVVCVLTMISHAIRYVPLAGSMFSDCRIANDDNAAWANHISELCVGNMVPVA